MRIVLTGGGTGGHFYPIIAVAEEVREIILRDKLVDAKLYYFANDQYNRKLLFENNIEFRYISAGKWRRYFSLLNFLDLFKTLFGLLSALWQLYLIYPDVVFGKGGYVSFPVLLAARILRLPVIIHESDSEPGRVNRWAAKFAVRIAVSYPEALSFFPPDKTALTGNPLRREIMNPISQGAYEFLKLDPQIPVVLITGGSQGAQAINDTVLAILDQLLNQCQVIHQVGKQNLEDIRAQASVILNQHPHQDRYKLFDYLNETALRMVAGIAKLIVSRAGSTIFEIAHWGIPSIIIPIPESVSHDQATNAFTYARSGGAVVIEQRNLTPSVLLAEITRILSDNTLAATMREKAKSFARADAGQIIAEELVRIALSHEA